MARKAVQKTETETSTVALNAGNEAVEVASINAATEALKEATEALDTAPKGKGKAPKGKVSKGTPKPSYCLYDNQKDIEKALFDIGTEIETIATKVAGSLRDKTCILAVNYAWLQSNQPGGWTFEHKKVFDFVKGAMFPKENEDKTSILSRSSLFKHCDLAVQLARIVHSKQGKFVIQEHQGELRVLAPWNFFEPTVKAGKGDVKNTNSTLMLVPSWVIEAQYSRYFEDAILNSYGRINKDAEKAKRTPQPEGHASKSLDAATLPELIVRMHSEAARLPEGHKLTVDMQKKAKEIVEIHNRLLGNEETVKEVVQVVEVDIKDASFEELLLNVRDRLPASEREWSKLSDNERTLLALIAERIMAVANPVQLAV